MNDSLVLNYHAASADWPSRLSVAPADIERQVSWLLKRGYRALTFIDLVRAGGQGKVFAVTFGARSPQELSSGEIDGNADNATVTPEVEVVNDDHTIENGEEGREHRHHGFRYRVGGAFRHIFGR